MAIVTVQSDTEVFERPPLIQEKVSLLEILTMLRERTNRGYMPTATGKVNFNSKPRYMPVSHPVFTEYPGVGMVCAAEYLAFDTYVDARWSRNIFALMEVDEYNILVDLGKCTAIVGYRIGEPSQNNYHWVEWPLDDNHKLAIDRRKLEDVIDQL